MLEPGAATGGGGAASATRARVGAGAAGGGAVVAGGAAGLAVPMGPAGVDAGSGATGGDPGVGAAAPGAPSRVLGWSLSAWSTGESNSCHIPRRLLSTSQGGVPASGASSLLGVRLLRSNFAESPTFTSR